MPAQVPHTGMPFSAASRIGLLEAIGDQQLADGGAFAAGHDQAVQTLEIPRRSDFDNRVCESRGAAQHGRVLGEVALNGEDADGQRHQPRVAIWFASPSVRAEMPTIGSPRPRETSTRMDGS